jgi:hypothetical protein
VPAAAGAPSERVRLARLALDSAVAEDGVTGADPGTLGLRLTQGGGEVVQGVTASVTSDGRYELSVHLVGRLVPLQPLGDRVRVAIEEAAASAGLAERLGAVHIAWEDVSAPGDPAPTRAATPVGSPPSSTPPRPGSGAAAAAGSGAPPPTAAAGSEPPPAPGGTQPPDVTPRPAG